MPPARLPSINLGVSSTDSVPSQLALPSTSVSQFRKQSVTRSMSAVMRRSQLPMPSSTSAANMVPPDWATLDIPLMRKSSSSKHPTVPPKQVSATLLTTLANGRMGKSSSELLALGSFWMLHSY